MDTSDFDRAGYYSHLRSREDELATAIHHHLRAQNVRYPGLALETWLREGRYGHRVQQVRQALEESEDIALASLTRSLGGIGLDAIWPILRLLCHDIALYLGGAVLAGGLIGSALGFLAAGFGALPGALAGGALGAQAGSILLGFLGLKSVVEYMVDSIPKAAHEYRNGFKAAWGDFPDLSQNAVNGPQSHSGMCSISTCHATRLFARGHEILVLALLTGIVAYLTRGKGNLSTLLAEVRQSARLGPKVANWLEANAEKLTSHPMLQVRGKGGAGSAAGKGAGGAGKAAPPTSSVTNATEAPAHAATRGGLRDAQQLVGKSEGGPGTWQTSPKRSGGAEYQERISGVQRGLEYDVPLASVPSGKVSFDGFDAERKVLLDAKDWKGYPPKGTLFWQDSVGKQALDQIAAARGMPIEWHFSSQDGMDAVKTLLATEDFTGIKLVLTPHR